VITGQLPIPTPGNDKTASSPPIPPIVRQPVQAPVERPDLVLDDAIKLAIKHAIDGGMNPMFAFKRGLWAVLFASVASGLNDREALAYMVDLGNT
jgi:hypothetical protein